MYVSPDPFIWVRDEVLDPSLCDNIISRFRTDDRKTSGVCGEDSSVKAGIKRSTDLLISGYEDWNDVDCQLHQILTRAIREYITDVSLHYHGTLKCYPENTDSQYMQFLALQGETMDTGYQIQETKPGDFYDWHDDSMIHVDNHGILHERTITYIWYLNDIVDEGETEFYQGIKIPPRKGRMLLFPSTWQYLHRGRKVAGTTDKYLITGWIHKIRSAPINTYAPNKLQEPQETHEQSDTELDYVLPE